MIPASASVPGRVNLIGEHTDYNGGYVLPLTLPQKTTASITPRQDGMVSAVSAEFGATSAGRYVLGAERPRNDWLDYVQGLTWALGERGIRLSGFDLRVSSDVPIGKGLSSSASLELAVLRALRAGFALDLSDLDLALLAHRAETTFVGAPVGIMDQMVCSLGDSASALFLDAATLHHQRIALPSHFGLGVIDSGIAHDHVTGAYRTRRTECERAAAQLGVRQLRDLSLTDLPTIAHLPEPLDRRARHVVTENARVLAAVDALRRDDMTTLGALLTASHASLRDDFEVSLPDIDRLVALATADPRVCGARLTGGGFGGAVILLCAPASARQATDAIVARYRTLSQRDGRVLLPIA